MSDVAALILAAGGSVRLGSPKQLLRFQGQTLLCRAARAALAAECSPVVVVLGSRSEEMRSELAGLHVQCALNRNWERGIGSSIRTGMQSLLHSAAPAAVLICLCDQPLVDQAALRNLIDARRTLGVDLCLSAYAETVGPPVLAGAEFFDELLALPDHVGAKALWQQNPTRCATVPFALGAIDIDTPSDAATLLSMSREIATAL